MIPSSRPERRLRPRRGASRARDGYGAPGHGAYSVPGVPSLVLNGLI
jgi:hypothetical protein